MPQFQGAPGGFRFPGFSSGLRLGTAIHETLFANHGMVIAHRIRGRRRYICLALKGHADACAQLEEMLRKFPGMLSAKVSPVTGSVTVSYNQKEAHISALFDALSHEIAGKHAVQEETIIPTGVLTAGDNLYDTFAGAARRISKFFNHAEPAFFTRVAGLGLLIFGIDRILMGGERPAGPQLLLWGLALLMRKSHPDPKLPGENEKLF